VGEEVEEDADLVVDDFWFPRDTCTDAGTQFTCFAGAKVAAAFVLSVSAVSVSSPLGTQLACFTSTKVSCG
jgi:hypothetical protein